MTNTEIIAQGIGILAMAMNCLSYQQKKNSTLILFQLVGSSLFAVNYFLLGALSGAMLNFVSICRAIVFLKGDRFNARHPAWLILFSSLSLGSYALVFTVFAKPFTLQNAIIELLPVLAMIICTVSYRYASAKMVRRFGFVCSPLWLTYNIVNFAIGAIACEVVNLFSLVIGTLRHDLKKTDKNDL